MSDCGTVKRKDERLSRKALDRSAHNLRVWIRRAYTAELRDALVLAREKRVYRPKTIFIASAAE